MHWVSKAYEIYTKKMTPPIPLRDLWIDPSRGACGAILLSKTQILQYEHNEQRVQAGGGVVGGHRWRAGRGDRSRERDRRKWWEEGRNRVATRDGTTTGWDELSMKGHGFEDFSSGRDGPGRRRVGFWRRVKRGEVGALKPSRKRRRAQTSAFRGGGKTTFG